MKKLLVLLLLVATVFGLAFARVEIMPSEGLTLGFSAIARMTVNEKGLHVGSLTFTGEFKDSIENEDFTGFVGEKIGFTKSLDKDFAKDAFFTRFLLRDCTIDTANLLQFVNFNAEIENGKFCPKTLESITAASIVYRENMKFGGKLATDDISDPYCLDIFTGTNLPSLRIGFLYSFDKDPAVTGLNLGFSFSDAFEDGKLLEVGCNGIFHLINDRLKVEDGDVTVKYTAQGFSNGSLALSASYRYSYEKGQEYNGIYTNIIGMAPQSWFDVSFGSWMDPSVETSFHIVDGKFKMALNHISLGRPLNVDYVSENIRVSISPKFGESFSCPVVEYRNYAGEEETNGFYTAIGLQTQWSNDLEIGTSMAFVRNTTYYGVRLRFIYDEGTIKTKLAEMLIK